MASETLVKKGKSAPEEEIEKASSEVAKRYEQKRRKALESILEQNSLTNDKK